MSSRCSFLLLRRSFFTTIATSTIRSFSPVSIPRSFSTATATTARRRPHLEQTATSPRSHQLYSPVILVSTRAISPTVRLLRFRSITGSEATAALALAGLPRIALPETDFNHNNDEPIAYEAGQWVDLAVPEERRVGGYSIVSIPDAPPTLLKYIDSAPSSSSSGYCFDLAIKLSLAPTAVWAHKAEIGSIASISFH